MKTRYFIATSMAIASIFFSVLPSQATSTENIKDVVVSLEQKLDARIGVAVLSKKNNPGWYYRADERFPMASTFKLVACAALLNAGNSALEKSIAITSGDILEYAPVTKELVGKTATASELCAITMRTSDNTAANKVLEVLGGPDQVTAFVRSIGDKTTNFNRYEPDLNEGKPDDERDTTTPRAMALLLEELVFGPTLDVSNRTKLKDWMISNEVSGSLLRASIPQSWVIADRSGAGGYGTRGIAAVIWPTQNDPIITTIYITQTKASMEERNSAIAEIGKAIASDFLD